MIVPLKSFQIATKANLCGVAMVPNDTIGTGGAGHRDSMDRLTWLCDLGVILVEKKGHDDEVVAFTSCVKAIPAIDLDPDMFAGKSKK